MRLCRSVFVGTLILMGFALSQITAGAFAQGVLVPGGGFSGQTPQPPTVGQGLPGSSAKVIAHWTVVPRQTFTGNLNIGVVAFHMNGIDRVEFSANGGPWLATTQMSLNPQSNVVEYWATLRAIDSPDGLVEVRAVAYPKTAGIPRVVSYNYQLNGGPEVFGCHLYANSSGTLPDEVRYVSPSGSNSNNGLTPATAYATIPYAAQQIENSQNGDAGGGTIYLMPSNTWAVPDLTGISAANRWLTIAGAPGTNPTQVVLASGDSQGLPNGLLCVRGLRIGPNIQLGKAGGGIWHDQIVVEGESAASDEAGGTYFASNKPQGIWATDCQYAHLTGPFVKFTMVRNIVADDIGGDLFREPRCVINVFATQHGVNGAPEVHSDFVQWYLPNNTTTENFIFYNVVSHDAEAGTQGIYDDSNSGIIKNNVAFVNVHIDRLGTSAARSQWIGNVNTNHFLLWHVTHDKISFLLGTPNVTNLSIRGCAWDTFSLPGSVSGYASSMNHNHFTSGTPYGSNATTGNPQFINAAANDYRPAENSPLRDRISPLIAHADASGEFRQAPADVGAFEEPGGSAGECGGDTNGDNQINVDDFLVVINHWGSCTDCAGDLAPKTGGDGLVNVDDLLMVIGNWGMCQ